MCVQVAEVTFEQGRTDADLASFEILVAEPKAVIEGVDTLLPTASQATAVPIEWLRQFEFGG